MKKQILTVLLLCLLLTVALLLVACNDTNDIPKASEGLQYTFADDGSGFVVTGLGSCTDSEIVIPAVYQDKISKVGKGNYAGKKVFLNHVQAAKLAQKLSSFNPSVNKSQTLLKYIVKQAGLGGLSQIASDTAGTVVNTVFDILTSIIP